METGVGTSVILRGGLAVIANELIEIYHTTVPEDYLIGILMPDTQRPDSEMPESADMLERTFFLDSSYRYTKSYNILMDIIPALKIADFTKFGDYVWDIQYSGTHLSMIQSYADYGRIIYNVLGYLRKYPVDVCGLSSVGPAIYCIDNTDKISAITSSVNDIPGITDITKVRPNNNGIYILTKSKI